MYTYITGTLVEVSSFHVVIDVHGIGYLVLLSIKEQERLPKIGECVCLYTAFVVREMSQTLYGFLTKEGRDLFEQLIAISGIGPKVGFSIISHTTPQELRLAVQRQDTHYLAKVPGIGKKTAERLLVDIKGRLSMIPMPDHRLEDALQALVRLGYTRIAAQHAIKKVVDTLPDDADLTTLITAALQESHCSGSRL